MFAFYLGGMVAAALFVLSAEIADGGEQDYGVIVPLVVAWPIALPMMLWEVIQDTRR